MFIPRSPINEAKLSYRERRYLSVTWTCLNKMAVVYLVIDKKKQVQNYISIYCNFDCFTISTFPPFSNRLLWRICLTIESSFSW